MGWDGGWDRMGNGMDGIGRRMGWEGGWDGMEDRMGLRMERDGGWDEMGDGIEDGIGWRMG